MLKIRNDLSVAPQTEAAMADRLAPALQVALAAKENELTLQDSEKHTKAERTAFVDGALAALGAE